MARLRLAASNITGKRSQSSVNYSLGGEVCGSCIHFIETNEAAETGECELVQGLIREDYWCKLFKRGRHMNAGPGRS